MPTNNLSILQINIWQGNLIREVLKLIDEVDADIVCMQEVYDYPSFIGPLCNLNSYSRVLDLNKYQNHYYSPRSIFKVLDEGLSCGNAILSKEPFISKKTKFVNGQFNEIEAISDHKKNNVSVQTVKIAVGSQEVTLANYHGYHSENPIGDQNTVEAMSKAIDCLGDLSKPAILAGDLNVNYQSPAMALFENKMTSLTIKHKIPTTLTDFGKVNDVACDHIVITPHFKENKFEVLDTIASDHFALYAELELV